VQHPHVKVEMPGVDAEPLRELPVRQSLGLRSELLEHAQAKRMAECLQLLGTIDGQRVSHVAYI
jgi:hypothetical protein